MPDKFAAIAWAMDLTPLVTDEKLSAENIALSPAISGRSQME